MTTEEPGEDHLQQRGKMKPSTSTILMHLGLNFAPTVNSFKLHHRSIKAFSKNVLKWSRVFLKSNSNQFKLIPNIA